MNTDFLEVVVSDVDIKTAQGTVHTPVQLVQLLRANEIDRVILKHSQEASYETIGDLIYNLTRAGIDIEIVERPIGS